MITVRYFAAARDAAGATSEQLDTVGTIEELKALLTGRPGGLGRVCGASSFLIDGEQAHAGAVLSDGAVVDVLPPFAGG